MSLHDELQRIADRAPVAGVAPDTWTRARRAHRRDGALAAAAAVAVVALLAAVVTWLPSPLETPVADGDRLGVPDHLYAVPERTLPRQTDLAIGRAAAAWIAGADDGTVRPVVVDATTGSYHLLVLPGFGGDNALVANGLAPPTIALSPDGRKLAYSYAVFGRHAATAPIPSGIRVLDLSSGTVRSIPVLGREGTAVTAIAWSADSTWIAFTGLQLDSWTTGSMGGGRPIVGRIGPSSTTTAQHRLHDNGSVGVAIDPNGLVRVVGNGQRVRWDGTTWHAVDLHASGISAGRAALTSTGVAIGTWDALTVEVVPDAGRVTTLDATGDLPPRGGGHVTVLGTLGQDLVVRTRAIDDAAGQLLRISPDGTARPIGTVAAGVGTDLSVATDLMTAQHPTVSRPGPDWPWSDERTSITIGLGVAAVIAAYLGLRWLIRRYRVAK